MPYFKQILKDTSTEIVVKFTGIIDATAPTADPANTTIFVAELKGAYDSNNALRSSTGGAPLPFYGLNVNSMIYSYAASNALANSALQLNWRGSSANSVLAELPVGGFDIDLGEALPPIVWDAVGTGANVGEIFITAPGVVSGTYFLVLRAKKNPAHYDRGYLTSPEYFHKP